MPIEKSKRYFHGKEGYNCAQAVAAGFSAEDLLPSLSASGGGRADGGLCGALYAAELLAGGQGAELIRSRFQEEIGAIVCREIKRTFRVPCEQCVETAAKLLQEIRKDSNPEID
jgi:hypothetical protein